MAIYNPAGLYRGAEFKVDTTSALNFFLKRQADKQAKEAALDKYYKGLTANATGKGMRSQEQGVFNAAYLNYKNFYSQNAEKIASGAYPELAMEAERLARIPFEIQDKSKQLYEKDKTVAQIRGTNPEVAKRWTKGTWDAYNKSTKSAYVIDPSTGEVKDNPDFSDFDPMAIVLNPKEVDLAAQWEKARKDIELQADTKDEPDELNPTFAVMRTVTKSPTLKGLAQVATNAESQWNDETEFTFGKDKTFAQFKLDSPNKFNEIQASFNKVYPGVEMKDDKDLYIGTAINLADKAVVETPTRVVNMKKWADYQNSQNIKASKIIADYHHSLNAQQIQDENNVQTYLDRIPEGTYAMEGGGTATKRGDRWYDSSGKPLTTSGSKVIKIKGAGVPNQFKDVAGSKYRIVVDYMDLHVKDGVAAGAYSEFTGFVPRAEAIKEEYKGTKQKPNVTNLSGGDNLGF